ncbi:MAG: SMC-Scp complex subunit ScpB [Candidatus Woesearchaeota archaeon]
MEDKKKVEAVLFSIGKEVSLERLAGLSGLGQPEVKKILEELKKEYDARDHSLRIMNRGETWKLTIRDEFLPVVNKLVTETDLDKALMETLAVIAWKYPVTQSEVIRLRHNKAYDHIKRLMELDFVEKDKAGRTFKLRLTKKFFEYFDLPSDEAKKAFLKNVPEELLKKAEEVEQESVEVELLEEQEKKEKKSKNEIRKALTEVQKRKEEN